MPRPPGRRRTLGAAAVALAAACSSHTGTATLSSPSPALPTSLAPTAAVTPPPTTTAPAGKPAAGPSATRMGTPSGSPAVRRTGSVVPARTPSPSPSQKPAPTGKTYAISEVAVYRFSPNMLSLHRGDSVLVTNDDSTDHTFTIASLGKDSGNMTKGATYRLTFGTTGTFDFVCTYHQSLGMTGRITVT